MFINREAKKMVRRFWLVGVIVASLLVGPIGCQSEPVIGPRDDMASIVLMRFETVEDGLSGVVYRRINRFEAFLAESDVPILVAFYDRFDPVNTRVIPRLEQMADDHREELQVVWIDVSNEPQITEAFSVEQCPHFTVVVDAVLKRSLVGFDDQGGIRLDALIEPYLETP
jgi:hypothetical protein